jgi:hypothetical protein
MVLVETRNITIITKITKQLMKIVSLFLHKDEHQVNKHQLNQTNRPSKLNFGKIYNFFSFANCI